MEKKVIWKFELKEGVEMPSGAQIVSIKEQFGTPQMWAICDPSQPLVKRHFRTIGTGWEFNEKGTVYIGSYFNPEGAFVWHVFEIIKL